MNFNVSDFKLEIEKIGKLIFTDSVKFESNILVNSQLKNKLLTFIKGFKPIKEWKLLYRASVDGFESVKFHEKCNNIPNTVTIIRSANGYAFGGFTTQAWHSSGTWKADKNAFIFSLTNADNNPQKFLIEPINSDNAIYCYASYGPTFGHDLHICDSANSNNSSFSNLGNNYYFSGSNPKEYLAGSFQFSVSDIEVFAITFVP